MYRSAYGKKETWNIYKDEELVCRLLTKTEADRLLGFLGDGFRYVKE